MESTATRAGSAWNNVPCRTVLESFNFSETVRLYKKLLGNTSKAPGNVIRSRQSHEIRQRRHPEEKNSSKRASPIVALYSRLRLSPLRKIYPTPLPLAHPQREAWKKESQQYGRCPGTDLSRYPAFARGMAAPGSKEAARGWPEERRGGASSLPYVGNSI